MFPLSYPTYTIIIMTSRIILFPTLLLTLISLAGCTQFTYPAPGTSEQEPTANKTPSSPEPTRPDTPDTTPNIEEPMGHDTSWIVETDEALTLITEPHSVIWDAREGAADIALEGAEAVTWQEFSRQDAPYQGLLLDDLDKLDAQIESRGVTSSRQVLVLDDPLAGWGEGGRLVWMLRTLGHEDAHLIMVPAPIKKTIEDAVKARSPQAPPADESFDSKPGDDITATTAEIQDALDAPDTVFIDVREEREYNGATPYGESRGGHLPGAIHIYFKDLLNERGELLPTPQLLEALAKEGVTPEQRIVAYCTGGIRSAWLVVVLKDLGFERVENYAGSMWEWAAQPEESHPLETR